MNWNVSIRLGNIAFKTDARYYIYNSSRPHAVNRVTNHSLPQFEQNITYTAFNKVSTITGPISPSPSATPQTLTISYGPTQERMQSVQNGSIITYAGNYEKVNGKGRYHIYAGGKLVAVYTNLTDPPVDVSNLPPIAQERFAPKIYYVHTDHLGSIVRITNPDGTDQFRASYDAWGKQKVITQSTELPFYRGYTGHEHIPNFGLINMNGRVYDPDLGRFLSPDPYVQMPDFSQNFNRYSYVLNNPLKYTDPSGEFWNPIKWFADAVVGAIDGLGRAIDGKGVDQIFIQSWKRFSNAVKIDYGLYQGNIEQIASRHTWESPQTIIGNKFSQFSNTWGQVDKVDYWGGATVTSGNFWGQGNGEAITLGSYITGGRELAADPNNPLFQHEYGHYLQSQTSGWGYLSKYGIPSALSKDPHDDNPVEQNANVRALKYFVNRFGTSFADNERWDFDEHPIQGYNTRWLYNDARNQVAMFIALNRIPKQLWFSSVLNFTVIGIIPIGLYSADYYNNHLY